MKTIVACVVGFLCMLVPASRLGAAGLETRTTGSHTVFVVRHAEKVADGSRDPDLSASGHERSDRLAAMLEDQALLAAFVTDTKRSNQTAAPLAEAAGIEMTLYKPTAHAALAGEIDAIETDGAVLVVGHSNTVSGILEALGSGTVDELGEDEYDNLFIVVRDQGEHVRTIRLRF